jgi:hypothetical protein
MLARCLAQMKDRTLASFIHLHLPSSRDALALLWIAVLLWGYTTRPVAASSGTSAAGLD